MTQPKHKPGVKHLDVSVGIDAVVNELLHSGGVIVENILSPNTLANLNSELADELDAARPGSQVFVRGTRRFLR